MVVLTALRSMPFNPTHEPVQKHDPAALHVVASPNDLEQGARHHLHVWLACSAYVQLHHCRAPVLSLSSIAVGGLCSRHVVMCCMHSSIPK